MLFLHLTLHIGCLSLHLVSSSLMTGLEATFVFGQAIASLPIASAAKRTSVRKRALSLKSLPSTTPWDKIWFLWYQIWKIENLVFEIWWWVEVDFGATSPLHCHHSVPRGSPDTRWKIEVWKSCLRISRPTLILEHWSHARIRESRPDGRWHGRGPTPANVQSHGQSCGGKRFLNPFLTQLYLSLQFMSTVPRVFPVLIWEAVFWQINPQVMDKPGQNCSCHIVSGLPWSSCWPKEWRHLPTDVLCWRPHLSWKQGLLGAGSVFSYLVKSCSVFSPSWPSSTADSRMQCRARMSGILLMMNGFRHLKWTFTSRLTLPVSVTLVCILNKQFNFLLHVGCPQSGVE